MVAENKNIDLQPIRNPRAPSKLPIRLCNSPKRRSDMRHIRSNLISSTPLNTKKYVQEDQLNISPIKNPSSSTISSANLNPLIDKDVQVKKITDIAEKTLSSVPINTVSNFYPFPLSRVRTLKMVLCDSDDSIFSKDPKSNDKDKKKSGICKLNEEKNNISKEKTNESYKLKNDILNNEEQDQSFENTNIFCPEVLTELKLSHKSQKSITKNIISVNKSDEKRILRSFKTIDFSKNTNSHDKSEIEILNAPKITFPKNTESEQKGRQKTTSLKSTESKSKGRQKTTFLKSPESKQRIRGKSKNLSEETNFNNKTTNVNNNAKKQSTSNKRSTRRITTDAKIRKTKRIKSMEKEQLLRKSTRRRMSCVKYWLNNKSNKAANDEKQITTLLNPVIKKTVAKNLSFSESVKYSKDNLDNIKDSVLSEKLILIPLIKKLSSPISKQNTLSDRSSIKEDFVDPNTLTFDNFRGSKLKNKNVSKEQIINVEKTVSHTSSKSNSSIINKKSPEKSIVEDSKTPEQTKLIKTVSHKSSKSNSSIINKETPEKCIVEDSKTPEQTNLINDLITLSTKKPSVGKKKDLRRSLAIENTIVKGKMQSDDGICIIEDEDGISSDTLLSKEPEQENIMNETRKRKSKNVDTFNIKKIKKSDKTYSFKNLAIEADISPIPAGGLADVKIKGRRCLLGCFGKFPRQYNSNINNPDISVGISLNNPYIATGIIELATDGKKKYEYAKKADLLFVVLEGMAEVGIGNSSQVLRMGQDFFVPRDTPYYIFNFSTTDKLLLYFTKYLVQ